MQHPWHLGFGLYMTRTPVTILVWNWEEGAKQEREKRVTPEFGERKGEKNSTPKFRALQFWCLMTHIAYRLMCFLVFMIVVHRMLKVTWTKALRKATPQKKTLWRSQVKIKKDQAKSKKWRIVLPLANCPVHQGILVQWLVPGGTMDEGTNCLVPHRTVRC
jgi:hypothetical protein